MQICNRVALPGNQNRDFIPSQGFIIFPTKPLEEKHPVDFANAKHSRTEIKTAISALLR